MKNFFILLVIICAILVIPGMRERVVDQANQIMGRIFNGLEHKTIISGGTRSEPTVTSSQQRTQAPTPVSSASTYRSVSDELRSQQTVTHHQMGRY